MKEAGKQGQKAHAPTDEARKLARSLSGLGVPQDDICVILDVTKPTLHKYYRSELDRGLAEANAKVAESLFKQAISGNTTAAIFWTKARMGWRETVNISNPDGTLKPEPTAAAVIAALGARHERD
jgi:hypothetical protein